MSFFDKDFRKEDLFLYLVTLGLLIFTGYYFTQSIQQLQKAIQYDSSRLPADYAVLFETSKMRYDFGSKVLLSNAVRTNMSFLLGTIMCLLGTMVVVRKIRVEMDAGFKSPDKSEFSLKTSSAGLTLAFLGVMLIIISVTSKDKYNISEGTMEATLQQNKGQNSAKPPDTTGSRAKEDSIWDKLGK
jgi:cytochrome c biogenesis factor